MRSADARQLVRWPIRLVVVSMVLALAGCGGPVELSFEIDKSACPSECSTGAPTFEFVVLRDQFPLECTVASTKQSRVTGVAAFDAVVIPGERLTVVALFSCIPDCVACWASEDIFVGEGDAAATLALQPSSFCVPPLDLDVTAEPCDDETDEPES